MRPGIFLSIVEFTPGDTRPSESAWVVDTVWRRRPSRIWLALCGSVLRADLLDAYSRLTRDDIQAVLGYAADSIAHEVIVRRVPGRNRWRREAGSGGVPLP
jgi:hypothetical protein